jgi:hypothetical protein
MAQGVNRVNGLVTDQSGSVIVNASVTAREVNTGAVTEAKTNQRGYYLIQLPVGTYDISCSETGFQAAVRQKVPVDVGADVSLDFKLQLATAQQTVDVVAEGAPLLRPDSSTVQTTVENKLVNSLPIAVSGRERNAASFLALTPGYQTGSVGRLNGGAGGATATFVDGAVVNPSAFSPELTTNMIVPSFAVEEFQVQGSTMEAQDGRTSGGVIKYALKSGTNGYHGSAFEFFRNQDLDARNFFSPVVAEDNQNEFGVELGGPVIIPHVYNGHNRRFFYMYYDGYRYRNTNPATVNSLLTAAMKTGDFSAAGIPTLYDPDSPATARTPFPGNIIPSTRLSPISTYFASLFPNPNRPGLSSNNLGSTLASTGDNQGMIKIDQVIHNGHLSVSYGDYQQLITTTGPFGPILSGTVNDNHGHRAAVNWDTTVSTTVLNHFNASFVRWLLVTLSGGQQTFTQGSNLNQLAGLAQGIVGGSGEAAVSAGGYFLGNAGTINYIAHQNWRLADDLTWRNGSHSLQFGASMDRISTTGVQLSGGHTYLGSYSFAPQETGLPGQNNTGFAAASYQLGQVDSGTWGQQPWQAWLFRPWGLYAQDSWKIRPNLTLNYGLRWEYERPVQDKQDRIANFDPTLANPGAGNLLGALVFAGHGAGRANVDQFAQAWHKGFGPRLGVAYSLRKNTVLRAGFTINYDSNAGPAIFLNQQGYFSQSTIASSNAGVTPAFNWGIGFPNVTLGPYFNPTFANGSTTAWMPGNGARLPMVENWNVSIQQMLPAGLMIDVAYVGLSSHHILNGNLNYNQLNPSYLSLGSALNAQIGSAAANAAGIAAPYPGFAGSVAQALRPYPQYQNITISSDPIGNNTYNALQVRVQRRFSGGLSLLVSYTYSKNLTDTDGTYGTSLGGAQNYYKINLEKAVQASDTPHALAASYSYELPVGTGKRFRSGNKLLDNFVLGGWSLSGIWSIQDGKPLGVSTEISLPAAGAVRANVVSSQVYSVSSRSSFDPAKDSYINKSAFALPASFTFGNTPRLFSQLRSFGIIQWNAAAEKRIPIRENLHVTLRPEFFNVTNTVNFNAPVTDLNNLSFGKITSGGAGRNGQVSATLAW